jgi:hypothetical protein
MSKIQEIEQALEKLPVKDFLKLAEWINERQRQLEILAGSTGVAPIRDHGAFLNSYSPQDEGLYDDAASG